MIFTKRETLAALVKALSLICLVVLSACAGFQADPEDDPLVFKENDPGGIQDGPGLIEKRTGKKLEIGI